MDSSAGTPSPFHSIRFKLLLVSLTLLVIPWAGYRYIQETEAFLRQSQESMLLGTAQAVAAILHNHEDMFTLGAVLDKEDEIESILYVHPLDINIQLDGYTEEWQAYLQNLSRYPEQGEAVFEYLLGERGSYLYLLLKVRDDRILYQQPGERRMDRSDFVELAVEDPDGNLAIYRIASSSPGWVNAERMSTRNKDPFPISTEVRIQGEWQERDDGYTLELRIPRYLVGEYMALRVADVDDPVSRKIESSISTTPIEQIGTSGRLIRPNPEMARVIGGLEHENARIWVLDRYHRVLARRGHLKAADEAQHSNTLIDAGIQSILHPLFRLVLDQPSDQFIDEYAGRSRLQGSEIKAALAGTPQTRRHATPDHKAMILSAAWPVRSPDGIVGTVLVEQSTNQILSLQNNALERLFGITLILFVITGLGLLGFATLLTGRIRRLHNQVEAAVTPDGRIQGELNPSKSKDEIGDLGRSFSSVLNRLSEYNHYLEAMSSRLAHELRTPLTIVKSSLEILETTSSPDEQQRYITRAREGTERLGLILHRMREATRLEQLLLQTEFETFDLANLLKVATESYRSAFPCTLFESEVQPQTLLWKGAPDLISQALDKLVANAVDFHTPGSTIRLQLRTDPKLINLEIINQGTPLPDGMKNELFKSMISIRQKKGDEPHLGLGLYLVRLICEFHEGYASAENLGDGSGVRFSLVLPLKQ